MRESIQARREGRVERIMGLLLRVGVLLAAAVALAGAVLFLYRHGSEAPHYHYFHGEPKDLTTPGGIFREAWHEHSKGMVLTGMLLLIATPIARVVFAVFSFVWLKDWLYTVISLIVLAVLIYSLLGQH